MKAQGSSTDLRSLKPRFASRFLAALSRIKRISIKNGGARRIKLAADASLAAAAGPRTAWSRAILRRVKDRALRRRRRRPTSTTLIRPPSTCDRGASAREDRLRRLVPGGRGLDFCSLLDETADYIKCLSTQVQVMQKIADTLFP